MWVTEFDMDGIAIGNEEKQYIQNQITQFLDHNYVRILS